MAPVSMVATCFTRNFPERSGKFRLVRNGSGKIRLVRNGSGKIRTIPNEQILTERLVFKLGTKPFQKNMQNFWEFLHKVKQLTIQISRLLSKVARLTITKALNHIVRHMEIGNTLETKHLVLMHLR